MLLEEITKDIFMELLRSYHDGVGTSHAACPQADVAHNLAKEAYFMALEYIKTIEQLKEA